MIKTLHLYAIFLLVLINLLFADFSVAVGFSQGILKEDISNESLGITHTDILPSISLEGDSYPVPLLFNNDYTSWGICFYPEIIFEQRFNNQNYYAMFYPLYINYYFKLSDTFSLGIGTNLGFSQLSDKDEFYPMMQMDGYQIFAKLYCFENNDYLDISYSRSKAINNWSGDLAFYSFEVFSVKYVMPL